MVRNRKPSSLGRKYGRGRRGSCGGTRRYDGSGRGVGNYRRKRR